MKNKLMLRLDKIAEKMEAAEDKGDIAAFDKLAEQYEKIELQLLKELE